MLRLLVGLIGMMVLVAQNSHGLSIDKRGSSFSNQHIIPVSASDPSNFPISVQSFLAGEGSEEQLLWKQSLQEPNEAWKVSDSDVLEDSHVESDLPSSPSSLLESGSHWVHEGLPPRHQPWPFKPVITNMAKEIQENELNPKNKITHALGVTSAAIPWMWRSYGQNHNSHRKAEPLLYRPMVIAKTADGKKAVDLTHFLDYRIAYQRSVNDPAYEPTLGKLTGYVRRPLAPVSQWLPQVPKPSSNRVWEKHFLDIYAPTPPPLRSPIPPQPKKASKPSSLLEQKSIPKIILPKHEHVKSLYSTMLSNNRPVQFINEEQEEHRLKHALDVDLSIPAHGDDDLMMLELDEEIPNEFEDELELFDDLEHELSDLELDE